MVEKVEESGERFGLECDDLCSIPEVDIDEGGRPWSSEPLVHDFCGDVGVVEIANDHRPATGCGGEFCYGARGDIVSEDFIG